jgi:hypothetical protein
MRKVTVTFEYDETAAYIFGTDIPTIKEDTDFFVDELHLSEKELRSFDETISNIKVEIIQLP